MPKRIGVCLLIVGALLLLAALGLYLRNEREDAQAGQEAESLLEIVHRTIAEGTAEALPQATPAGTQAAQTQPDAAESGTILEAEERQDMRRDYESLGYLAIPALDLELPVLADWDYERLKTAPCRQFGTAQSDDLVIVAHNYKSHFGSLHKLQIGDSVSFVELDGSRNLYTVAEINAALDANALSEVQNSGFPLVLYTCTYGGKARVAVFCERES